MVVMIFHVLKLFICRGLTYSVDKVGLQVQSVALFQTLDIGFEAHCTVLVALKSASTS